LAIGSGIKTRKLRKRETIGPDVAISENDEIEKKIYKPQKTQNGAIAARGY
jgi:hypothetical protein